MKVVARTNLVLFKVFQPLNWRLSRLFLTYSRLLIYKLFQVIARRFGWKCSLKKTMDNQTKNLLGDELLFHQALAYLKTETWLCDISSWGLVRSLLTYQLPLITLYTWTKFKIRKTSSSSIWISFYLSVFK